MHPLLPLLPPPIQPTPSCPSLPLIRLPHPCNTVAAYCQLAAEWGVSPTSLALRFVLGHPLVASAVVGATSSQQLDELIAAAQAPPLEPPLLEAIDAIHQRYPNPAP